MPKLFNGKREAQSVVQIRLEILKGVKSTYLVNHSFFAHAGMGKKRAGQP